MVYFQKFPDKEELLRNMMGLMVSFAQLCSSDGSVFISYLVIQYQPSCPAHFSNEDIK